MNIKKYWMVLAIALTGLCTVSCEKDDNDTTEVTKQTLPDPDGTIETYITDESINLADCYIKWTTPNNLVNTYNTYITDVGEKRGLADVMKTKLPEYGSGAKNVACKPGHGYILECGHNGYGALTYYCAVYVVKNLQNQSGSVYGAEIKYISLGNSGN